MTLGELIAVLETTTQLPADRLEQVVPDIAHDSRNVTPGSLFVAVRGFHSDGHQFIPQAVQRGAAAVVAEEGVGVAGADAIPLIRVADSRAALARLAPAFFKYPSRKLKLIGVTGTNGKTTTTYLVKSIIEAAGRSAGLIGTIDYRVGDRVYPAPNTTPESLDLQRFLSEMVERGAEYCVMEVSSHALALGRTAGCTYCVAGFTNLTQDHLDFHETMEAYYQTKLRLFSGLAPEAFAVINADDARAAAIRNATKATVVTTGFSESADAHPSGPIRHDMNGLTFDASSPVGTVHVESPLVGRHNVHNILTAIGIGAAVGFSAETIARGIRQMRAVPGRMEKVDEGQAFGVFVDYAHTEDALVRLLEAVREFAPKRIITVFGCGGDRDRTKRPKMGAAAIRASDIVIVTSDNPRSEDPAGIISEIETGMTGLSLKIASPDKAQTEAHKGKRYLAMPDRREAVAAAVRIAAPGDVVVLAGKGHENYQIVGEKKIHFDDREAAREEIRKCLAAGAARIAN